MYEQKLHIRIANRSYSKTSAVTKTKTSMSFEKHFHLDLVERKNPPFLGSPSRHIICVWLRTNASCKDSTVSFPVDPGSSLVARFLLISSPFVLLCWEIQMKSGPGKTSPTPLFLCLYRCSCCCTGLMDIPFGIARFGVFLIRQFCGALDEA